MEYSCFCFKSNLFTLNFTSDLGYDSQRWSNQSHFFGGEVHQTFIEKRPKTQNGFFFLRCFWKHPKMPCLSSNGQVYRNRSPNSIRSHDYWFVCISIEKKIKFRILQRHVILLDFDYLQFLCRMQFVYLLQ